VTLKLQIQVSALFTNYTYVDKVKIVSKLDGTYFIFVLYAFGIVGISSVNLITGNMLELSIYNQCKIKFSFNFPTAQIM
jgi:hypothetical protein